MAVTDDERFDLARIKPDDFDVVEERLRGLAEIQHHGALVITTLRLEQQREAEFVVDRAAIVSGSPKVLDRHAVGRSRWKELVKM
jgi:hypothetical protein